MFLFNDSIQVWSPETGDIQTVETFSRDDAYNDYNLPGTFDVYSRAPVPVRDAVSEGYYFHHGIWNETRTAFAFLEFETGGAGYRVQVVRDEQVTVLLDEQLSEVGAFRDVFAWTGAGDLLLAEKQTTSRWFGLQLYAYNVEQGTVEQHPPILLPHLNGRNLVAQDYRRVILGHDGAENQLYSYRLDMGAIERERLELPIPQSVAMDWGDDDYHEHEHETDAAAVQPYQFFPLQYGGDVTGLGRGAEAMRQSREQAMTQSVASTFSLPMLDAEAYEILGYGWYSSAKEAYHGGEDWVTRDGACNSAYRPVYAMADGLVVFNNTHDIMVDYPGNVILVEHMLWDGSTYYSQYGHLATVEVGLNQTVTKGQRLGTLYDWNCNSHLHWEVRTRARVYSGLVKSYTYWGPGYWPVGSNASYGGWVDPSDFVSDQNAVAIVPPDFNRDEVITPADVVYVVNRVGQADALADLDGSGTVDAADVSLVVDMLGQPVGAGE